MSFSAKVMAAPSAFLNGASAVARSSAWPGWKPGVGPWLSLAEVPAILGLVLFMLFGLRGDFYVLLALSLALEAFFFPRLDGWRAWAAEPAPGS